MKIKIEDLEQKIADKAQNQQQEILKVRSATVNPD